MGVITGSKPVKTDEYQVDIRLIPMLAALYLICHIDRANIGNAKIEGMIDDLNMTGVQYNIVLSICKSIRTRFMLDSF